ncbi:uncharacterized protein LOC126690877 [Quercus robur]|uniref:uncharacterized protein LOC126690877 n=1 Tax=Quercus robur TaxID=38942 RepID=UPI002162B3BB|nr:uncharacterized protein LOC126690877 [Quercus robur]
MQIFSVGKAHEVISIEDLTPLTSKPSNKLMSSHIHRVMQVLGESLYLSRKYLDYKEKYVLAQSKVESVSFKNASLAEQVTKLTADLVKAQDCLSVLEKDLKTEKTFCALKDKQLEAALGKIEEAQTQAMTNFKNSDEYDDKLCALYVEGFDLVRFSHHLEIDLSTLDIEKFEIEIVADQAVTAQTNDVVDKEAEAPIDNPVGPVNPVDFVQHTFS